MATIPLGLQSLTGSSNLPVPNAGRAIRDLFGLAPGGVYHATNYY
ncbi:S-adenosyl-methyltransferase [Photobacterium profundum 3TCK]|uniref:S-adenosyl-methyltransferase n=1 Tax=Photobacterium profundum 3TCK TaxID=314280 RepID=Q1Z1M0_9GAMM|nr:S-adenosyl-methyltransferase [Photobacterium profundum 3TCK]